MNKLDEMMMDKLIQDVKEKTEKYRVMVDNDSVWVEGKYLDDVLHNFSKYGWEFIVELLKYLEIDAEEV